jgi:hypothetical protein
MPLLLVDACRRGGSCASLALVERQLARRLVMRWARRFRISRCRGA